MSRTVKEHYEMIEDSRARLAARQARKKLANQPVILRVVKDKPAKVRNRRRVAG